MTGRLAPTLLQAPLPPYEFREVGDTHDKSRSLQSAKTAHFTVERATNLSSDASKQ